jgi:hypothetical protein
MKEITLDQVKVGDLIWDRSDFPKRTFPKLVTKITDTMVFSKDYRLPVDTNSPDYILSLGLKGVKTTGDHWDGSAIIPIKGNENKLVFGPEAKEKKTYKHRGVVRNNKAWLIDFNKAKIEYDFYIR